MYTEIKGKETTVESFLPLELGQTYKTRAGNKVMIKHIDYYSCPFFGDIVTKENKHVRVASFNEAGMYKQGEQSQFDIVGLWEEQPSFSIPETLKLIEVQTGLRLELCTLFTGIRKHNGREYFNVILPQRISESKEYDTLKRFADKYKLISVEPNGLNRVAVLNGV